MDIHMSLTKLFISPETMREHRATWWVYAEPGNTDRSTLIRHQSSMRGMWGYEVKCSCGWETNTGGGLRRYVADQLFDHRLDASAAKEVR